MTVDRSRYDYSARYFAGAVRGWGRQDFAAGSGPNLTLTANENGDFISFNSSKVINSTAILCLASDDSKKPYTGAIRLFSTKVEVSTHTGAAVVLTGVPAVAWGTLRVYYLYNYTEGIPVNYTMPSKAIADTAYSEFQDLFVTEEEITAGTIAASFASLVVDNLTLNGASIVSDTGAISFGDDNLSTTGTLNVDGHSAFGTDAGVSPSYIQNMDETYTHKTGTKWGYFANIDLQPSDSLTGATVLIGCNIQAEWNSGVDGSILGYIQGIKGEANDIANFTAVYELTGVYGKARNLGGAAVTAAYGVRGDIANDDAFANEVGNITKGSSLVAGGYTDKGTGIIVTRYGLEIEDITGGGLVTNQYGIYCPALTAAGTDNYFIKSISAPSDFGTGTINAGAITGTSFTIAAHTLAEAEFHFLDGQDQSVLTTSNVTFDYLNLTTQLRVGGLTGTATAGVIWAKYGGFLGDTGDSWLLTGKAYQGFQLNSPGAGVSILGVLAESNTPAGYLYAGYATTAETIKYYVDVTGTGWFAGDIKINDGILIIPPRILIGTGNDLKLFHDGTDSYIYNDTGILKIQDAGSGINLGMATTELLGFYGVTPVDQPGNTEDIKDALVSLGLIATGGATPLNLDGGLLTANGGISIALAEDIQFRDAQIYIASLNDGYLDLEADVAIRLNADVNLTGNLWLPTNYSLQLRDAQIYVNSFDDGHLDLTADISIDLNAPAISTIADGTAPYQCTSTTLNTNLNADYVNGIHGFGYTLTIISSLLTTVVDGTTYYVGGFPLIQTTVDLCRVYIPKAGTIKAAYINTYATTAGTNEDISVYIRLNNTSDTLIQTVGAATNERLFSNAALSIAVVAGDYIEIKVVCPTWVTNPATWRFGGSIYIE